MDTNIKIWDIRMKSCINTFKSHQDQISCLDISPDSLTIASGSQDGTIKLWDLSQQKLIKSIQASAIGYPTCVQFNPCDLCLVIGTSDKLIKYWELQDYTQVSSSLIENYSPSKVQFDQSGKHTFVSFEDCIKVYILDDIKPIILDIVTKPIRSVHDLKINCDQGYLFLCEEERNTIYLSQIELKDLNFNPNLKPVYTPINPSIQIEKKPILQQQIKRGLTQDINSVLGYYNNNASTILAQNGINMMGVPSKNIPQRQEQTPIKRTPSENTLISFYEMPTNEPSDINIEDFLKNVNPSIDIEEDLKIMNETLKDHTRLVKMLRSKNEQLRLLQKYWNKDDQNSTFNILSQTKDSGVLLDFLSSTLANGQRVEFLSFDHLIQILQIIETILNTSKFETQLNICVKTVKQIMQVFNERVLTIQKTSLAMGTDIDKLNIEQQDRKRKCDIIVMKLSQIVKSKGLKKLVSLSNTNSNLIAKNVQIEIDHLLKCIYSLPGNNLSAAPSSGQNGSPFKTNFIS